MTRPLPHATRIITFPHDDAAFRAHVLAAHVTIGRWDEDAVLAELRSAYPRVTLRRASALASLVPSEDTWYAYRDGAVMPAASEAWWHDSTLPRTRISSAGEYTTANEAAAELFGVPTEEIPGSRIGRFTRHEASEAAGLQAFEALARTGSLHSTAIVVRPTGEELAIEYRIDRSPDGHFDMVMRRIHGSSPDPALTVAPERSDRRA